MKSNKTTYRPRIPRGTNHRKLFKQAAAFFDLSVSEVRKRFQDYRRFYRKQGYRRTLSEKKTLCREEAFLVYLCLLERKPARALVEVGTQYGQSTRRIVDIKNRMGLDQPLICFDIIDMLKHCSHAEVDLRLEDLTGQAQGKAFEPIRPAFIYLDAHPYFLLKDMFERFVEYTEPCIMAVHDCSRGLCNRHMTVPKDDPEVTSKNGVWERHVLAEVFGIDDPLDPRLDTLETDTHKLRIFDTPHGLALIRQREHSGRTSAQI